MSGGATGAGRWLWPILLLLGMLAAWHAAAAFVATPWLLPSPLAVARAMGEQPSWLAWHAGLTLLEMLIGLAVGATAGIVLALAMTLWRPLGRALWPVLVTTQTLPVFAIAPLLVIWLGFGLASKVVMAALITFFPVVSSFHDGLRRVPPAWRDLSHGWAADPLAHLRHIALPAALPSLASGLKIAATAAPIGAVVGEWAGAAGGLGYVMLQANARVQTDLVFATLVLLALSALALRAATAWLADRLIFWQPTD